MISLSDQSEYWKLSFCFNSEYETEMKIYKYFKDFVNHCE